MSNIKMETVELPSQVSVETQNTECNEETKQEQEQEQVEETKPEKKHTIESLTIEIAKYLESNHQHITFQDKVRQTMYHQISLIMMEHRHLFQLLLITIQKWLNYCWNMMQTQIFLIHRIGHLL